MANGASDRRFEILRQKAEREARAATQEQTQSLRRQFARTGGIGSGAFIKASQQAEERGAKRLGAAREGIEFARLGELERERQIKAGREFATSEREAGQTFAAAEALKGRAFATSEREAAEKFASAEAELGRRFTSSEREAIQAFQRGERIDSQTFQLTMFDRNFRQVIQPKLKIAQQQLGIEQATFNLNKRLQLALAAQQNLNLGTGGGTIAGIGSPGATVISPGAAFAPTRISQPLGFGGGIPNITGGG